MLVLSRKLGESIEIGDQNVIVRVLGIRRSKVQLGVDAPPEIVIHRSEIAASSDEPASIDELGQSRASSTGLSPRKQVQSFRQAAPESPSHDRSEVAPTGRVIASLNPDVGESILQELAKVQAEVAALAELASDKDRMPARELAAEAADRLTAIERTVRLVQHQACEQPISTFVGSRSQTLRKMRRDDQSVDLESDAANQEWDGRRDDSATLIRESKTPFTISSSQCSVA